MKVCLIVFLLSLETQLNRGWTRLRRIAFSIKLITKCHTQIQTRIQNQTDLLILSLYLILTQTT